MGSMYLRYILWDQGSWGIYCFIRSKGSIEQGALNCPRTRLPFTIDYASLATSELFIN